MAEGPYLHDTQPAQEEEFSQSQNPSCWGILKGFGRNKTLRMIESNRDYVLGRHSSSDLRFENNQVSNRHCVITRIDRDPNSLRAAPEALPSEAPAPAPSPQKGEEPPSPLGKLGKGRPLGGRNPSADKALVVLKDFSSNGTYLNGKLIGKKGQAVLTHKDIISLASKNAHSASPDLCGLLPSPISPFPFPHISLPSSLHLFATLPLQQSLPQSSFGF